MTSAFALAGWHFSGNPTSSSSENKIAKAPDSEPWKTGEHARYQYHPHGDTSKAKKDAPSALNEVIIPNVNLPKVSLDILSFCGTSDGWSGWGSWGSGFANVCILGTAREVQQVGQGGLVSGIDRGTEWF